jgi:hypothetical protein
MGSCDYYAKWKFKTTKQAQKAFPFIIAFLSQANKAYEYWQKNRGNNDCIGRIQFWAGYKKQFPLCYEFMESIGLAGHDCGSTLSGQLSIGSDVDTPELKGTEITYSQNTWHCADWSPVVKFLASKMKAESSGWVSENEVVPDFFAAIEMS